MSTAPPATIVVPEALLKGLQRNSPRLDLSRAAVVNDAILMAIPYGDGCVWLALNADGRADVSRSMGEPCAQRPDGSPRLTPDGGDPGWRVAALAALDEIARATAQHVVASALQVRTLDGAPLTVAALKQRHPGLRFADESRIAGEVGIATGADTVAIAVRGASGTCYYVSSQISTSTVTRYGTGTECTAAAAAASTSRSW